MFTRSHIFRGPRRDRRKGLPNSQRATQTRATAAPTSSEAPRRWDSGHRGIRLGNRAPQCGTLLLTSTSMRPSGRTRGGKRGAREGAAGGNSPLHGLLETLHRPGLPEHGVRQSKKWDLKGKTLSTQARESNRPQRTAADETLVGHIWWMRSQDSLQEFYPGLGPVSPRIVERDNPSQQEPGFMSGGLIDV